MSNALLSWDDFDEPETAIEKAKKAVSNIDTTEADKEFEEHSATLQSRKELKESGLAKVQGTPITNPTMTQQQLTAANQKLLEEAMKIVDVMDAQMVKEGAVNVSDKFLINCRADLNQLVPFKYNQMWGLYLTGCEQHWMPAEYSLEKDKAEFNNSVKDDGAPVSQKSMLARAFYMYRTRVSHFGEVTLLQIYRLITNPECRQYILRQSFESALIHHAWIHITESLTDAVTLGQHIAGGNRLIDQIAPANVTFVERNVKLKETTAFLNSLTAETASVEDMRKFVLNLMTIYGYINWTMVIGPYYQILNGSRQTAKLVHLIPIFEKLIRDASTQTLFAKELIRGILEENPQIMDPQFVAEANKQFKEYLTFEQDLASTLANTDTEYKEVEHLVDYYMVDFFNEIGVECNYKFNRNTMFSDADWFKKMVINLTPKLNHEAGLGGGHLNW